MFKHLNNFLNDMLEITTNAAIKKLERQQENIDHSIAALERKQGNLRARLSEFDDDADQHQNR